MNVGRLVRYAFPVVAAVVLVGSSPVRALAQDHDHGQSETQNLSAEQKRNLNQLVAIVRDVTKGFKNSVDAERANYHLMFGCVSGPDFGAMGLHFVNTDNLDEFINARKPEIILYEAQPDGTLKLTGADYLVDQALWDSKHPHDPPQLYGQFFHLIEAPNRFGLDPFYTLHVWAWKDSPTGTFANWNANVSCDAFNGRVPRP
jgi:hypothetical protein